MDVICDKLGGRIHQIRSLVQCELAQIIGTATNTTPHSEKVKVTAFEKLQVLEAAFKNVMRKASVRSRSRRASVITDAYFAFAYFLLHGEGLDVIHSKSEA